MDVANGLSTSIILLTEVVAAFWACLLIDFNVFRDINVEGIVILKNKNNLHSAIHTEEPSTGSQLQNQQKSKPKAPASKKAYASRLRSQSLQQFHWPIASGILM
jgi:hypothetical protein